MPRCSRGCQGQVVTPCLTGGGAAGTKGATLLQGPLYCYRGHTTTVWTKGATLPQRGQCGGYRRQLLWQCKASSRHCGGPAVVSRLLSLLAAGRYVPVTSRYVAVTTRRKAQCNVLTSARPPLPLYGPLHRDGRHCIGLQGCQDGGNMCLQIELFQISFIAFRTFMKLRGRSGGHMGLGGLEQAEVTRTITKMPVFMDFSGGGRQSA